MILYLDSWYSTVPRQATLTTCGNISVGEAAGEAEGSIDGHDRSDSSDGSPR